MLLLDAADSAYAARIEHAANDAGLSVQHLDNLDAMPADAPLIGVGPSISDPLDVARHLRGIGGQALLVFFTDSSSVRDTLQAELIRDPFLCARYELIAILDNRRHLATRMGRVVEHVQRHLHAASSSRGRRRSVNKPSRAPDANAPEKPTDAQASTMTETSATDLAALEAERRRLEEALREARRQKDEFLAIMSHELRTPLTSIMGYTDMLLRGLSGPLAPLTTRYLGNVRSAGDRLLELVNGLLDYTRLEAGADRLEAHPINLMPLVRQSVQRFQVQADGRRINLRLIAKRDLEQIQADGEKIDHVLRSFLGNALKFTPEGGWIAVRVDSDPVSRDAVRVSVADSGIGLRAEQVGRVWERFYQGDASLTRPYGGMGLGLSIAQHLVALHGGAVGAESRGPGLGSTFWFSLPLAQAS
jgi:signal transduction histidine kinase